MPSSYFQINKLNADNTVIVDNQSLPGNGECNDVVITYINKTLHVTTADVWKKNVGDITCFEQLPKRHFGSRINNSHVVSSLLEGLTTFEDVHNFQSNPLALM